MMNYDDLHDRGRFVSKVSSRTLVLVHAGAENLSPDKLFSFFKKVDPKQAFLGISSVYKVFSYIRKQRKASSFCGRRPHKIETFS